MMSGRSSAPRSQWPRRHAAFPGGQSDVFPGGSWKLREILHYDRYISAQGLQVNRTNVSSIPENRSLLGVVETAEQLHERGFPGAVLPYNCHSLAQANREADLFEHRPSALRIGRRRVFLFRCPRPFRHLSRGPRCSAAKRAALGIAGEAPCPVQHRGNRQCCQLLCRETCGPEDDSRIEGQVPERGKCRYSRPRRYR